MKLQIIIKLILLIILIQSNSAFSKIPPDSLSLQKNVVGSIELEYPYIRHLGNFGKVWSNSQGLQLSYGLNYNNHYMLIFKSGYLKTNTRTSVTNDSTLKVIPLTVVGKYLFNFGSFRPYFSMATGFNLISGDYTIRDTITTGTRGLTSVQVSNKSETFFKFYFQVGTGAYFKVYKNFNLDLGLRYNSHFYREEAQMTGFEYSIGVSYVLNKLPF